MEIKMRRPGNCIISVVAAFVVLLSGCVAPTGPYDYSALENSRPRSILVIPPLNNSIEVNAPYIFLATITRPLAEKGYYVFPVAVIDAFLKENGLPTPAEMNGIPLDKIAEHIGADAVLYVSIEEWGQKYQLLSSSTIVHSTLRLVDVNTGVLLWQATVRGVRTSDDGGGGLLGAIVGAIATQIAGSVTDYTPELSSASNRQKINDESTGLLHGPYFNPDGTIVWRSGNVGGTAVYDTWQIFTGTARGEIAAKSYDKELWAKALLMAEGDQQKQEEIYIELRSKQLANEKKLQAENQLYSEKVGAISTTNLSQQAVANKQSMQIDFSGTYVSEITSDSQKIFPDRDLVITLVHKGDSITGFDSSGTAKISGTIEDGSITFYVLPNAMTGFNEADGVWKIKADGTQLEGKWTIDGGGGSSGTWDLTKSDSKPIALKNTPESAATTFFDLSGTYMSKYTGKYLKRSADFRKTNFKVKLVQDGKKITGTFGQNGMIWGDIVDEKTIKFEIFATGGYSRRGTWVIDPSNNNLEGTMTSDEAERWNLIRIQ
jgi:hypothetical protein